LGDNVRSQGVCFFKEFGFIVVDDISYQPLGMVSLGNAHDGMSSGGRFRNMGGWRYTRGDGRNKRFGFTRGAGDHMSGK
jgi:hypothetical protein